MANINFLQMAKLLRGNNPQQICQQIITQYYPNDPLMKSMYDMMLNGNSRGVENLARQILGQQGLDLDSELASLVQTVKSIK